MKITTLIVAFAFFSKLMLGQETPKAYFEAIDEAEALYTVKDYKNSAKKYTEAFRLGGWKGYDYDRYNAACSWALAGGVDSAFFQLEKVAKEMNFLEYDHIKSDTDLVSLYTDKRWMPLIELIKKNKDKAEADYNRPLIAKLDSVLLDDQTDRQQINAIEKKYGWESKEMKSHLSTIHLKDSVNLIKVKSILDKYGWLGPNVVGLQGNSTLFLVIQHADLSTQKNYLPMLRSAVKKGNAQGSSLALLEDRVAIMQGRPQVYGTQIGQDPETKKYFVMPLRDPDNVDKRRAEVDLESMEEYIVRWQLKWNVDQYKKE
jgi:hypothetical protein